MTAFGITDVGRIRSSNEDSWGVFPDLRFFIVADGMGGHAAGEVASRMAVETMRDFIRESMNSGEVTWPGDMDLGLPDPAKRLTAAGKLANEKIYLASQTDPALKGMGTTMVAVLIEPGAAHLAHVGDSRAYLLRGESIVQLTEDHSLINDYINRGLLKSDEAGQHPLKHVITRALGSAPKVEVDLQTIPLKRGDSLLLCSDGLSNLLTEKEMLFKSREDPGDLASAGRALVDLANQKGGEDNITLVILQFPEI